MMINAMRRDLVLHAKDWADNCLGQYILKASTATATSWLFSPGIGSTIQERSNLIYLELVCLSFEP